MKSNFSEKTFSFFNPKNKKIKKEQEPELLSSSIQFSPSSASSLVITPALNLDIDENEQKQEINIDARTGKHTESTTETDIFTSTSTSTTIFPSSAPAIFPSSAPASHSSAKKTAKSQLVTARKEAAKISAKKSKEICQYCKKFEDTVRYCTANCEKKFRWSRNSKYQGEKYIAVKDTNGCPFCCGCIECEERITNYRKSLTKTSKSTVISNRSSRCKIQLSNETEELIPDILQLYISLVLSGSEKHIVTLIQSTMYLLPEAILTSNGEREKINLESGPTLGYLKLTSGSFCTVICRSYQFIWETGGKNICLCSCQYESGNENGHFKKMNSIVL